VLILERDVVVVPRRMQSEGSGDVPTWVRIAGFGNTDPAGTRGYGRKRRVDVPIKTWACRLPSEQSLYACKAETEFVAAPSLVSEPMDSCTGDSGGPAYAWIGNEWILCGAVSRATANSARMCGDGGVYVKVQSYERWIRSVAGAHW
jgi:secreted trypsin-like serine protease